MKGILESGMRWVAGSDDGSAGLASGVGQSLVEVIPSVAQLDRDADRASFAGQDLVLVDQPDLVAGLEPAQHDLLDVVPGVGANLAVVPVDETGFPQVEARLPRISTTIAAMTNPQPKTSGGRARSPIAFSSPRVRCLR